MSYILDALKKSDQERQQGNSPHLYSMHRNAPPRRNFTPFYRRRGLWLLVGGVLLLSVCMGIFLLVNRQSVPPAPPASHETTNGEKAPEPALQSSARQDAPQKAPQQAQQQSRKIVASAADTKVDPVPQVIIKENNVVLRSVPLKEKALPPKGKVGTADKAASISQLQDLPADIRAAVPELKFAGHTYSEDPAQRMIIVNGQILREGDTISAGTRLAHITWDGVIVDFQGNLFLVKTN